MNRPLCKTLLSYRFPASRILTFFAISLLSASTLLSAQVAPAPASVSWASVAVGSAGGPKPVTFTNHTSETITISSIAFAGANPGDFSIYQNTCQSKLAASASCTTTILFKPTATGTRTATLVFTDSGAGSPHQVSVSGLGTTPSSGSTSGASIMVNFNSRSGGVSIPANMLGTEYFENLASTADRGTVVAGGFTNERYRLVVPNIFPTSASAPVWSSLDRDMNKFVAAGVHPLIELVYTPTFLRPKPLPTSCTSTPEASIPTSVQEWGHLAALIAAHLDSTHRGLATYYEIWNEPNQAGLCGSSNKLADYEKIYYAAASQIQAQGQKDGGLRLYTGGPGAADVAFTDILTNPLTAKYVDFYSYHFYVTNGVSINRGMNWNGEGGKPSLFAMMQSSTLGVQARYLLADNAVKSAKTPMGSHTPIFYDEFNDDWYFANDCCRNSPTYSPLYNSIAVADILNSVYKGANEVPARMIYYSAINPPFCIMGVMDAAMDCARPTSGQTAQPYPQWYVYKMMFSPSFLDLQDGGNVATSITPSSGAAANLIAAAFYTKTSDSVIVINPTGSSFTGVSLQMSSPGLTGNPSTYIINAANPHISNWTTTTSSGGAHITFNLPAYSVVGISLK